VNVYFIRNDVVYNNTGHVPINVTFEVWSRNQYCRGKANIITYFELVTVTLFIQHAMRMHHIILFPVACPSLSNVCASSHKRHEIRGRFFLIEALLFYFIHKFCLKYFSF